MSSSDDAEDVDLSSSSSDQIQSAQRPTFQVQPEEYSSDSTDGESSNADEITAPDVVNQDPKAAFVGQATNYNQATAEEEDAEMLGDESPDRAQSPVRPNKYHGPASTWRDRNAPERDLAASLDKLTAKDLSLHLYNAFKLKKLKAKSERYSQLQQEDNDNNDHPAPWLPPKQWTAWPLPLDEVPREEDGKRWEDSSNPSKPQSVMSRKPGDSLRELMVAQILRQAKLRFLQRESENVDVVSSEAQEDAQDLKPVIMADDDLATTILQSTVQHILTKLDKLLMGLHHARSSYLTIDDSASGSESRNLNRSRSRGRPAKRQRSLSDIHSEDAVTPDVSSQAHKKTKGTSRSTQRSSSQANRPESASRGPISQSTQSRKSRLGLRDWSDVLGIASMNGWDPTVMEKATARCTSLFGEGITFRTLEEGNESFVEHSHLPHSDDPLVTGHGGQLAMDKEDDKMKKRESQMLGGVHIDGYLQPIKAKKSWKYPSKKTKTRSTSRRSEGGLV